MTMIQPHFGGTTAFRLNAIPLDSETGKAFIHMVQEQLYGPKASWKSSGSFNDVVLADFGYGKVAQEESFRQALHEIAKKAGINPQDFYQKSEKRLPADSIFLNPETGELEPDKHYEVRDGQWVVTNEVGNPEERLSVEGLAELIRPLNKDTNISGYGGAVSKTLYGKLCDILGVPNHFAR